MRRRPSEPREMLKMADLVRVSGTARSTIHFYRNVGLLPPPTRSGRRLDLYGTAHVRRLREIAKLRADGTSVADMQKRFARRAEPRVPASTRPPSTDAGLRAAIAAVAAPAFVKHGYEATRVADIARAVGIGKAKLYSCYPSKADLFVDCLERLRLEVYDEQERARLADLSYEEEGRLRASAALARFAPYRMMSNLLAQAAYGPDASLAQRARAALHRLVTGAEPMFDRAVRSGEAGPMNTELVAYMAWGALLAVGDRLALDGKLSPEEALTAYLDFVLRGTRH